MNKLAVSGLALALASCTTLQSGGLSDIEVEIQNAAIVACGFVPIADTIRQILAANDPKLQTASAVANAICAAVAAKTTARGLIAVTPQVDGVRIVGAFVR